MKKYILCTGIVVLFGFVLTACGCSHSDKKENNSSIVNSIINSSGAVSKQESSSVASVSSEVHSNETSSTEKNNSYSTDVESVESSSSDGLTYIKGIWIVNKTYSMPADYNKGVDPTAQSALEEMFNGASNDGIDLFVVSGFRSYSTQKELYDSYVATDGKEKADTYSARPGHSEHQTGLAFDLNYLEEEFADTPEGKWLAENCWKYGFTIRYPKGKESKTGYTYEPWHVRYLGKSVAADLHSTGQCLEEYLSITSEYQY